MRRPLLLAALALLPAALPAQDFGDSRCIMVVDTMLRYRRVEQGTSLTFYAGGLVRLSCQATSVKMQADSMMAVDNFRITYFVGAVHYSDSTMELTADRGTYFKDGERWEARGNVVARPPGTRTSHSFRSGPEGMIYLAYGTREPNDICYYPRSNKIFFRGLGVIGRLELLEYSDGEPS